LSTLRLPGRLRQHWPDIVIIAILALLPALFFWRLIAPNPADRMSIPAGDFTGQYYPLRAYAARELAAGRLPLWNPSPYGGQPALADIQSGALYPPQIVEALLLGWLGLGFPVWALELQVIAHFAWAAVGAYLLGRRLAGRAGARPRTARLAGTVTSLVFTYSGYLTGFPVQQLTILEVSAWLPWVVLAMEEIGSWRLEIRDWRLEIRGWVLAGLALGVSLLPGHPQTSLYVLYTAVAFYLFRAIEQSAISHQPSAIDADDTSPNTQYATRNTNLASRFPLPALRPLIFALLLAGALAAAQLLPTLEFIARSPRADMSYEAVSFGLPLHELVSLVYPGYFGGSPEYVGILPMVLIGLALAVGRPKRDVIFWTVTGLLAMLLAFGGNTFLYPIFYLAAPGFDAVRDQERAFLVYALSAAILSGYGALALASPLDRARRATLGRYARGLRILFVAGLALTALFFYGWLASQQRDLFGGVLRHHVFGLILLAGSLILLALRPMRALRRPWGMALLAGWIAFNLFSVNWRFNLEQPGAAGPYAPTPLTDYLRAQAAAAAEPIRIASAGLLPGGAGAATVYGLQDIAGNTPLHLAAVEAFEAGVPEWRRWQLLNVRYVLSGRDLDGPGLTRVFPAGDSLPPPQGQVRVYAMGDPFPRAWVVHGVEVIPDERAALARLGADDFDLRRAAVVAEPLSLPLSDPGTGSTARVTAFAPNEMTVEVSAAADGLLVMSEVYYPGWQASVDGAPAALVRADGLLRGIPVPQGQHIVRMWYAPGSVGLGLAISGLALAVSAGGFVVAARRRAGESQ
jgi:uncharacterized membrane protein YgdD (TMEM256/DUF423 family)